MTNENCSKCGEAIYEETSFELQRAMYRELPYHLKCAGEAMKEREQSMEVRETAEHNKRSAEASISSDEIHEQERYDEEYHAREAETSLFSNTGSSH